MIWSHGDYFSIVVGNEQLVHRRATRVDEVSVCLTSNSLQIKDKQFCILNPFGAEYFVSILLSSRL